MARIKKKQPVNDGPQCLEWLNVPHSPRSTGERFVSPTATRQKKQQGVAQLVDGDQYLLHTTPPARIAVARSAVSKFLALR